MASLAIRNRKGQSIVEFALVVPMLLILVIGIAEFGRAWMTKNILTGAAREAVRMYAIKNDVGDWNIAQNRAVQILSSANLDPSRWGITPSPAPPVPSSVDNVSVTVTYNFPVTIFGFLPGLSNDITISSSTTMRKEN